MLSSLTSGICLRSQVFAYYCGSIRIGYRFESSRIIAFYILNDSFGKPLLSQDLTKRLSAKVLLKPMSNVRGIPTSLTFLSHFEKAACLTF